MGITLLTFALPSFSQQKDTDYKLKVVDSGFLFLIGPHDHFLFIPSAESEIENLFRSNNASYYLALHLDYISTDNYNKLVEQKNELRVDFKGGGFKIDSANYARVYLKVEIPISRINQKGRLTAYYLKSKLGAKKLYSFTRSAFEFLDGSAVLSVL